MPPGRRQLVLPWQSRLVFRGGKSQFMLGKAATPRISIPRSNRAFSQGPSSPGPVKPYRKPAHARRQPPSAPHLYSRRGVEKSLLRLHAASKYYSPQGRAWQPSTMDQPSTNQLNYPRTQMRKETRREPLQQDLAAQSRGPARHTHSQYSGTSPGVGGDDQLAQGYRQRPFPTAPLLSRTSPNEANNSFGFPGPPFQNDGSNVLNTNTAQSLMSNAFPAGFFTPTSLNMDFFSPSSHSFWPPPSAPPVASSPAHQNSTGSRTPVVIANPSAAATRHRLDITAPSESSGGIPDPTDAYLMRASFMPKRREQPGPLLVIIDLNGTLLYRPSRKNGTSFQSRHHTDKFVTYCVQTFWVVFWSSAKPENVKGMVDQLLSKPLRRQIVGVWGRDKFGLTAQDYNKRTQCYKRLTRLWDDPLIKKSYPNQRPGFEGGCWDQGNTVLIDDSAEKARSEPHNAITLPEYLGGNDDKWDVLPSVHDYLNELCYQEDVSAYMRAHPFKMS